MTLTDEMKVCYVSILPGKMKFRSFFFVERFSGSENVSKSYPSEMVTHAHAWDAVYLQTFPRVHINFRTAYTRAPPDSFYYCLQIFPHESCALT